DDDGGRHALHGGQPAHQLDAADPRQPHVQQQQVRKGDAAVLEVDERLLGRRQGLRRVALFAELQQQTAAYLLVVLDDYQSGHAVTSSRLRGTVSRKVVPAPELAITSRSPP